MSRFTSSRVAARACAAAVLVTTGAITTAVAQSPSPNASSSPGVGEALSVTDVGAWAKSVSEGAALIKEPIALVAVVALIIGSVVILARFTSIGQRAATVLLALLMLLVFVTVGFSAYNERHKDDLDHETDLARLRSTYEAQLQECQQTLGQVARGIQQKIEAIQADDAAFAIAQAAAIAETLQGSIDVSSCKPAVPPSPTPAPGSASSPSPAASTGS